MAIRQRLRKANTRKRDRGCFGRRSSTPHQPPPEKERDLAIIDNSSSGPSIESPTSDFAAAALAMGGLCSGLERSSSRSDGSFLVHLRVDIARGSEGRKKWLRHPLYGDSWSTATEGTEFWRLNPGEDPGEGVRELMPKPLVPMPGSAAMPVDSSAEEVLV